MSSSAMEFITVTGSDQKLDEKCESGIKINISSNNSVIQNTVNIPKYFVGVSLATHGADGDNLGCDEAEIIYIGWVIVDSRFGKVISKRSSYVKPANLKKVDWTLLKQRGVEETDLRNAPNLGQVLQEFDIYLHEFLSRGNNNLANAELAPQDYIPSAVGFVTDGALPIRQCLHPEAVKKNMVLSQYYWSFFDLRKCAKSSLSQSNAAESSLNLDNVSYADDDSTQRADSNLIVISDTADQTLDTKPNVKDALDELGRSLSKLIIECRQKGFLDCFAEPEVVKPNLEHGICNKDDVIDSNTVIRARGLPWQSSDEDVAKFFSGLNIAKGGVALVLSQLGRRNGEALVRFETPEQREMALRRHRHFMGDRYIEVYRATGEDFIKVAAGNNDAAQQFLSQGEAIIIRMRGLPYECSAEKIIEFFKSGENPIVGDLDPGKDILFVNRIDGKATGDAFVRLIKDDEAKALGKHKEVIGTRYIELFKSTTAEVQQVLNKTMEPMVKNQPEIINTIATIPTVSASTPCLIANGVLPTQAPIMPSFLPPQQIAVGGSRKDCIRLRGLPYEAQVQHILDFLGDFSKHVLLQGVHMVLNAQGHPSGEAFIQLDSELAAAAAANDRHNKYMQIGKKQRYIEVFQCSADDMSLVLTGPATFQPPALISAAGALQTRPILHPGANLLYPNAAALAANLIPAAQLFAQQNPLAQNAQLFSATGTFPGMLTATAAQALPNVLNGTARLPIIPNFAGGLPAAAMASPGALLYWPYPSPPVSPPNYYAALIAQAAHHQPGMVLLRNLPITVTAHDVLNLFQGYVDLTVDCVQIQRTATGQPTGEALVTFPNRFDAEKAVLEKNRQLLGTRPIELFIYGI